MGRVFFLLFVSFLFVVIDYYLFIATKSLRRKWPYYFNKTASVLFWIVSALSVIALFTFFFGPYQGPVNGMRRFILVFLFLNYLSKLFTLPFLLGDDIIRLGKLIMHSIYSRRSKTAVHGKPIPRSEFLAKAALIAGGVPLAAMSYGIVSGAYDYRVIRRKLVLPNLPKKFHGLRLAQISDIHSGSFFNKTAVEGGIDMLLGEKPDLIFFTGDLVNSQTSEVNGYFNIFRKIKAPLGTYSVLGNHDYGDYRGWPSEAAKRKNLMDMIDAHKELGYDLLMNENRYLEDGGERIAIIGVENWGAGRFQKYGDLPKAYKGTEESPVKLLLSHDPSHWDAMVRPEFPDIDVMFAGHTHGFQFGVEIGKFKWSPAQYAYKQWADLYTSGNQQLYVNRGYGFIGYPGRIGIMPEITVFELLAS